jgi:hypothetical protein
MALVDGEKAYKAHLNESFVHQHVSPKTWCSSISFEDKILQSRADVRPCRILHYEVSGGGVYIFASPQDLVTAGSVGRLVNVEGFAMKGIQPTEKGLVLLERLLSPKEPHQLLPRIIVSDRLFTSKSCMIAIQLTPTRTSLFTRRIIDFFRKTYTVNGPGPLGRYYHLEPTPNDFLAALFDNIIWLTPRS